MKNAAAIHPGAVLGLLGGGQLGRMTAIAARALGYGVVVLDPDPECAASVIADRVIVGAFDDVDAAIELARASTVVTYEIEKISRATLEAVAAHTPLRPHPDVLLMVQNRARQKQWLVDHGFAVGPYRVATTGDEAQAAVAALGGPCILKAAFGGYDGRGQIGCEEAPEAAEAFARLGAPEVVVERRLVLNAELSVLVARRPGGEVVVFPPAKNWHEDGILRTSVCPGPLAASQANEAMAATQRIAETLALEGIVTVEWFATPDGLRVNEMSPRPHNTFHATEAATAISQFEQLTRAVFDLPLGVVEGLRPTAMGNLLGDLWLGPQPPDLTRALEVPGVHVHLYGKEPRPARKVGHLLAVADSAEVALARVAEAFARLERGPSDPS